VYLFVSPRLHLRKETVIENNHDHDLDCDLERDDYYVNNVDVVNGMMMNAYHYDLQTATAQLFEIFGSINHKNVITSSDNDTQQQQQQQLAHYLLQQFSNMAQTFSDCGELLLNVACRNKNVPESLI